MDMKEFFEKINKLGFEITKSFVHNTKESLDASLSHSHICMLMYIKNEDTCIVTNIARHLRITLSAVTNLVNKLFEMGLVTRIRSEEDRRIVVVRLTDKGRDILKKIDETRTKLFEVYFSNLSEEELHSLLNIINKISDNVINAKEKTMKHY